MDNRPPMGKRPPMGPPPSGKEEYLGIAEMVFLTPENAKFYKTKNGFVCMNAFLPPVKKDDLEESGVTASKEPLWQDLGRVFFHRAFPFDTPDEFISVLDKDGKEYGVIRRITDFPENDAALIRHELERKYFMPEIRKIDSLKARFGYTYWEVETDRGHLSFAIHDTFRNIAHVGENRIVISDVDGNRYGITDVSALDRASYRRIELYL